MLISVECSSQFVPSTLEYFVFAQVGALQSAHPIIVRLALLRQPRKTKGKHLVTITSRIVLHFFSLDCALNHVFKVQCYVLAIDI